MVLRLLLTCLMVFALGGCFESHTPPKKPAAVPAGAFFCGGMDGGVFVHLHRTANGSGYEGAIYHDFTGEIEFKGRFEMDPKHPGEAPVRGRAWCGGWDGDTLYLHPRGSMLPIGADGKVFKVGAQK